MPVLDGGAPTPVAHLLSKAAEEAGLAPSVLNTQPWRWEVCSRPDGDVLRLFADPDRRLESIDPSGRLMTLSCGAALHHARAALAAAGYEPAVSRFPDPGQPELLAQVRVGGTRQVQPGDIASRASMRARHSDRRPFPAGEPVPEETIDELRAAADAENVTLYSIEADQVGFLASAAAGAHTIEAKDEHYRTELGEWTHRPREAGDGVPLETVVPQTPRPVPIRPFSTNEESGLARGSGDDRFARYLVLATSSDSPADWLRCGEATSSVWLTATARDLAVSVLSEVVEVAGARALLRGLLDPPAQPQLVLRVGLDRQDSPPPASPRRHA